MNIFIAGDFCPYGRVAELIDKGDFKTVFGQIKPLVEVADFAVLNLECPVDISSSQPITKCGPNLRCSVAAIDAIKYAGFSLAVLANNHIADYGDSGIEQTIEACRKEGIFHVGAGMDRAAAQEAYHTEVNGLRVAVINFCENEFSGVTENSAGACILDPVENYYSIKAAISQADRVIVIIHGGSEEYQLPSPRMKRTYRFFADAGADVVINHHQHCFSGYEVYNGTPIFYGLGNFSFDWPGRRRGAWNEGYGVMLDFSKEDTSFTLHPYIQGDAEPGIKLLDEPLAEFFYQEVERLNRTIADDQALEECFDRFAQDRANSVLSILEPCSNRYYRSLLARKWIPSLIGTKKRLAALNLVRCESHRDILLRNLQNK